MTTFRVWAPEPEHVAVEIQSRQHAMTRLADDWWELDFPDAAAGTEYAFVLDHSEPIPDPRSAFQPQGIEGPSCVVDHDDYDWHDAGWSPPLLHTGLIYELHVGTFTAQGTFEAAIDRLDYLVELGVTHVELMPVNEFSGSRGWGYDGVDLYAPHHAYGGPTGLKKLVDACHQRGLAVLLDVVYNHLGPVGNYLGRFGPYFTDRYGTPWGDAVNFDSRGSDEVRRFVCDNALMWLRDYHFDGLRIDAVHAIYDTSAVHILEQLVEEVTNLESQLGRTLVLIAESDLNNPRLIWSRAKGGYGLDAQWSDDFHHALHAMLTGESDGYYEDFGSLEALAKSLKHAYVYDGQFSRFRGRRHGRPTTGTRGHQFLAYLQNHDQVGNRAQGDRSSHLLSQGRLKIGAALVLTSPFVPMLFQGEEWATSSPFQYFTDHGDPQLANAVREGRRSEFAAFGWSPEEVPDPQSEETFQRSKLNWEELDQSPHAEMLDWHRRLIQLRQKFPELTDDELESIQAHCDEDAGWLMVYRGRITIYCCIASASVEVPRDVNRPDKVLLSSSDDSALTSDAIRLAPDSVVILGP